MNLNTILKIFLPKDRVFYQLFESVAEELVNLIAAQRAYEINTRAVTASDQILQRVSNLGT